MIGHYMENLSDLELINNLKKDTNLNESLNELINRHSGIYLDMVNSYMRHCPLGSMKQDIINDKELTIYNSALKYDSSKKTKFSTFLGNEAKWKCLNANNKNKKIIAFYDTTYEKVFPNQISYNSEINLSFKETILKVISKQRGF